MSIMDIVIYVLPDIPSGWSSSIVIFHLCIKIIWIHRMPYFMQLKANKIFFPLCKILYTMYKIFGYRSHSSCNLWKLTKVSILHLYKVSQAMIINELELFHAIPYSRYKNNQAEIVIAGLWDNLNDEHICLLLTMWLVKSLSRFAVALIVEIICFKTWKYTFIANLTKQKLAFSSIKSLTFLELCSHLQTRTYITCFHWLNQGSYGNRWSQWHVRLISNWLLGYCICWA